LNVAIRIRKERQRLGLSQSELGLAVGSDHTAVNNWENAGKAPDLVHLSLFASIGADVLYILTGTRTSPAAATHAQTMAGCSVEILSKEEQALLGAFRQASDPC
jgi:transcriptional regulator with XRE-family HTH domain